MALAIKTDEADALARALSERTGETLTAAVTNALLFLRTGSGAGRAAPVRRQRLHPD